MGRKQFSQRPRSSPGVHAPAARLESSSRQACRPLAPAGGPISSADSAAVPVGPPSCSSDRPAVGSISLGPAEHLPVRLSHGLPPGYDIICCREIMHFSLSSIKRLHYNSNCNVGKGLQIDFHTRILELDKC